MSEQAVYTSALGIATGDIVTTSYGTGPYEVVGICGPFAACDGTEYVSLALRLANRPDKKRLAFSINGVRRDGERWLCGMHGDELFVEKRAGVVLGQMSLFAAGQLNQGAA